MNKQMQTAKNSKIHVGDTSVQISAEPMKKTCDRCRALYMSQGAFPICKLGFKLCIKTVRPLEPCSKPLTIEKYLECKIIRGFQ